MRASRLTDQRGGVTVWVLTFVLTSAAALAALVGIGCAIGANACPFGDDPGITATDGDELYLQAGCIGCHGPDGGGTVNGPTLITGRVTERSFASLVDKIGRGGPPMPRYKGYLTTQQIQALARYVQRLQEEAS